MTKTVLVNLYHLQPAENGGVSRIVEHVCQTLLASYSANIVFAVGWRFADQFAEWLKVKNPIVIPVIPETGPAPILRTLQADLIVSPLFGTDPFDAAWGISHDNHIALMCDAQPLDKPEYFEQAEMSRRKSIYQRLSAARVVVTLSQHSKSRLLHHLALDESKVEIIPPPVELPAITSSTQMNGLKPYLYYPANDWPHKRHKLAFEILKEIWKTNPSMKLVLSGKHGNYLQSILSELRLLDERRIVNLGFVSDDQVAEVYQCAEALLFPSDYEGFGIPVVEAMGLGCPVIAAHSASIPEVVRDAGILLSSTDSNDWATAVLSQLPSLRSQITKSGYDRCKDFAPHVVKEKWMNLFDRCGLARLAAGKPTELVFSSEQVSTELKHWAAHHSALMGECEGRDVVLEAIRADYQTCAEELNRLKALAGRSLRVKATDRLRRIARDTINRITVSKHRG